MDSVSDFESGGCGFESRRSCRGRPGTITQEDVFCHVSSIMDGNALAEGARVTYLKVFDDRRGKDRANQVRGGFHEQQGGGGGFGGGGP